MRPVHRGGINWTGGTSQQPEWVSRKEDRSMLEEKAMDAEVMIGSKLLK